MQPFTHDPAEPRFGGVKRFPAVRRVRLHGAIQMAIDLGDDDGFISVTIGGVTQSLDLYAVVNRLVDINQEREDAKQTAYVALISELGFPSASKEDGDPVLHGCRKVSQRKKRHARPGGVSPDKARLTRFYRVSVFHLTPAEQFGLMAHERALRVQESRRDHAGKMTDDELYDCAELAYGRDFAADPLLARIKRTLEQMSGG